jgi:rhamnogalacturonan endolyase
MVDYASNHRGSATMNITTGFDRIFGPSFIYVNRDGDVQDLLADAEQYAYVLLFRMLSALKSRNSTFASDFYDEIARYIHGYVPSSGRGDFNAKITLPDGAGVTKAVLSMNGADMQDNVDYSMSPSFFLPSPRSLDHR